MGPLPYIPPLSGAVTKELQFRFLNVTRDAEHGLVDWAPADVSKLWRYNLHYFDYLLDETLTDACKAFLVSNWIERNPPGQPDAWEPYPVSLRIVNWVKYFLDRRAGGPLAGEWQASLFAQARWLERRLELDLMANHLLKNAVALLFAGAFFEGASGDRWLLRGWHLFREQLREQFLPDGGHFERSPMYHCLCLADCLDVLALTRVAAVAGVISHDPELQQVVRRAADFLCDLTLPDDQIALFNDSAFDIAPTPRRLLEHARLLLPDMPELPPADSPLRCELIERRDSGYFGFRHGRDMLIVDCGAVGPDYQPGHAHCDTLSYELAFNGSRLVVDGGVHDYETGIRRKLARSTAGHNTVMIDGHEQSEIWGGFRVGRRARPLFARMTRIEAGCLFEGAHDGYCRLPGAPVHRRRIAYDGHGSIEIQDQIEGTGEHLALTRVRIHPSYTTVINGQYADVIKNGSPVARIQFRHDLTPQLERGEYFPQFGLAQRCDMLVLRARGRLPLQLGYRIIKATET